MTSFFGQVPRYCGHICVRFTSKESNFNLLLHKSGRQEADARPADLTVEENYAAAAVILFLNLQGLTRSDYVLMPSYGMISWRKCLGL